MNVLFVCSGNVSRSFLAENLLREELTHRNGRNVSVASAGLIAYTGSPPDPRMVEFLKSMHIQAYPHKARRVNEEDVQWADLILVMEKVHAKGIGQLFPEAKHKVQLLGAHVPGVSPEIKDPFCGSEREYSVVQSKIFLACQNLASRLVGENGKSRLCSG